MASWSFHRRTKRRRNGLDIESQVDEQSMAFLPDPYCDVQSLPTSAVEWVSVKKGSSLGTCASSNTESAREATSVSLKTQPHCDTVIAWSTYDALDSSKMNGSAL